MSRNKPLRIGLLGIIFGVISAVGVWIDVSSWKALPSQSLAQLSFVLFFISIGVVGFGVVLTVLGAKQMLEESRK